MIPVAGLLGRWKDIGLGVLGFVLLLTWLSLKAEQRHSRKLARANAELVVLLETQNAAVAKLKDEGDRRQAAADRALKDANEANKRGADQSARLRTSASRPVAPAADCAISDELKKAEGLL